MEPVPIGGYHPGVVGAITELHATYYHTHWGLDRSFETQIARELADFVAGFEPTRDGLWAVRQSMALAGSIAIDGRQAATAGARLRWFIVAPACQKTGLGRALIGRAVEFCRERGCPRVFLWTFKGLDAARRLYERTGFRLSEEHALEQWGQAIVEQKFELDLLTNA
jgi:GNAT superfamily N-acetyltransferase